MRLAALVAFCAAAMLAGWSVRELVERLRKLWAEQVETNTALARWATPLGRLAWWRSEERRGAAAFAMPAGPRPRGARFCGVPLFPGQLFLGHELTQQRDCGCLLREVCTCSSWTEYVCDGMDHRWRYLWGDGWQRLAEDEGIARTLLPPKEVAAARYTNRLMRVGPLDRQAARAPRATAPAAPSGSPAQP